MTESPDQSNAQPVSPKDSITARQTKSVWSLLGRTQGQRGAEIFAAARAKYDPSPEHTALSRMGAESLVSAYLQDPRTVAFFIARPRLFQALIMRELKQVPSPLVVEMAAGFLPRGLIMARENPTWTVIEVDLPDVIDEKRFRFVNHGITVPSNLTMISADLGVTPLKNVLDGKQAHIITAEGLMMYFPPEEQQQILRYVQECLLPGGIVVFDMIWGGSIDSTSPRGELAVFRQAGNFTAGLAQTEEDIKSRFGDMGFSAINVFRPSTLEAEMPHLPSMTYDGVLIVVAEKGK